MRYTRIDIEGEAGIFASITRKRHDPSIVIEIITPEGSRTSDVRAGDREAMWAAAKGLQAVLDGRPGAGGDIRDYFTAIEMMGG